MYDVDQQLDVTQQVLLDVTDQAEQDDETRVQLYKQRDVVSDHADAGLSPQGVAVLKVVLEHYGVGQCGLESFTDDRVASTRYVGDKMDEAILEAENDMTGSMESFIDIFKSFNTKAVEAIELARKEIIEMQGSLPRGGKGTIGVGLDYKDFEKAVSTTTDTLAYLITGYRKEIARSAEEVAEQMRKVFSNRASLDLAVRNMKKVTVPGPAGWDHSGTSYTSDILLGGTELTLILSGTSSDARERVVKNKHDVEITTDSVLSASKKIMTLLTELERFLKTRQATEDALDRAEDRKNWLLAIPVATGIVGAIAGIGSGLGAIPALAGTSSGIFSGATLRRYRLLFQDDNQKDLSGELKAAVKTLDNTIAATRRAVSELLRAGNALKA